MLQSRHHHVPGEVIHGHRHDDHQLIYVARGVLAVQTEHGAWVACADRAVWVPAAAWHEHQAYGDTIAHTLMFPVQDPPLPGDSPTVVAVSALLRELLIACTEPELTAGEIHRIRAVLGDRLRRADVRALTLPSAHDPRLAYACRLVLDDLSRPRTIAWLSRQVNASERTLARLFRTEFGTTYPQWRTNARIIHAMIRLAEGATVTETAHLCGWATTSAFVDIFARTMGQTPGSYRSTSAS